MFHFIKTKLKNAYNICTSFSKKVSSLFSRSKLDEEFLQELFRLLITADTGVTTSREIIKALQNAITSKKIASMGEAKELLAHLLYSYLPQPKDEIPEVLLLVGINGSGKTTFAAKYAHHLKKQGKKVLLVAADTFRAAAVEQLSLWAQKSGIPIFTADTKKDPASVIYDACATFLTEDYGHLIIDTAGRLQTKVNLMKELEKIRRVIGKKLPHSTINTWLTIDAMLGQNSLTQAQVFHAATNLDGIVVTKLDGTGKGGILFALTHELKLPVVMISFGENLDDMSPFNPQEFVAKILGIE